MAIAALHSGRPSPRVASLRDWGMLLACNAIWGSQFVLVKLVQDEMGPLAATFLPMAAATLFLAPLVLRRGRARLSAGDLGAFALLGVLGQVAAQLLVTWGSRSIPASNGALLVLALPVVTAVMAFVVLGERMTARRWVGFVLALAGVLQCAGIRWGELDLAGGAALAGNLLVFGGVLGSAFYNTYGKRVLARHAPLPMLFWSYVAACLLLGPLTAVIEPEGLGAPLRLSARAWIGLGVLAGAHYFLSMVVFLRVLSRIDATQTAVSNYLIPVFGVAVAALVLGERPTPATIAGGGLVLASTLLVTAFDRGSGRTAANAAPREAA